MNVNATWFEVILESEVVLTARSATVGAHATLDYLPGAVLLGAAASTRDPSGKTLFERFGPDAFLGGALRFGDALPIGPKGRLGYPTPLCFHGYKNTDPTLAGDELVNALQYDDARAAADEKAGRQLRQCRSGYVVPPAIGCAPGASLGFFGMPAGESLKTAIDRDRMGRARDEQLFGYEALPAGLRFHGCLRHEDGAQEAAEAVLESLERGPLRLGRSRSAQYGSASFRRLSAAEIEPEPESDLAPAIAGARSPVSIYCVSDLALACHGAPTFEPDPAAFGLPGVIRLDERTFVRTRRFAPWNAFWQCRDTERVLVARGSVFTFEAPGIDPTQLAARLSGGVGTGLAEGFGRVLVNPAFVTRPPARRANLEWTAGLPPAVARPDTPLTQLLVRRQTAAAVTTTAHEVAARFSDRWYRLHCAIRAGSGTGASQWDEVRQQALAASSADQLADSVAAFASGGLRSRYWLARASDDQTLRDAFEEDCRSYLPDHPWRDVLIPQAVARAATRLIRKLQSERHA